MNRRFKLLSAALVLAALYSACGGTDGDGDRVDDAGVADSGSAGGGAGGGSAPSCIPGCPSGTVCRLVTNTCVECLESSHCDAGFECQVTSNTCRLIPDAGTDAGMDAGTDAGMDAGGGGGAGGDGGFNGNPDAGPGDNCFTAIAVSLAADSTQTFLADTSTATDDEVASCSNTGYRELVYEVVVPPNSTLDVALGRGATGSADPLLAIRSASCGSAGVEEACRDDSVSSATTETATIAASAAARTLWIFAETFGSSVGPVSLTLTTTTPLPGESCANAAPVTLVGGNGSVIADTTGAGNDFDSSYCSSPSSAADLIFSFEVTDTRSDIDVYALPITSPDGGNPDGGPGFDLIVAITDSPCGQTTELDCRDYGGRGKADMVSLRAFDAGTYFVVLDGYNSSARGPANIIVETRAASAVPANDVCSAATATVLTATTTGDTTNATEDMYFACGGFGSIDVAYRFTPAISGDLTVTAQGVGAFRPIVAILPSCVDFEIACGTSNTAGVATATAPVTANVPVYLIVDGPPAEYGAFTITATVQ